LLDNVNVLALALDCVFSDQVLVESLDELPIDATANLLGLGLERLEVNSPERRSDCLWSGLDDEIALDQLLEGFAVLGKRFSHGFGAL